MKRSFSLLAIIVLLILSCGQKGSSDKNPANKDSLEKKKDDPEKNKANYERTIEDLQKLTPGSEDEMRSLLPRNVQGFPLANYTYNKNSDVSQVSGEYVLNENSKIEVTIYDCAGDAGAGLYSLQYVSQLDFSSADKNETWEFPSVSGNRAIEHCIKSDNECTLTWFTGKRYLVVLEGKGYRSGELKDFVGELNIR